MHNRRADQSQDGQNQCAEIEHKPPCPDDCPRLPVSMISSTDSFQQSFTPRSMEVDSEAQPLLEGPSPKERLSPKWRMFIISCLFVLFLTNIVLPLPLTVLARQLPEFKLTLMAAAYFLPTAIDNLNRFLLCFLARDLDVHVRVKAWKEKSDQVDRIVDKSEAPVKGLKIALIKIIPVSFSISFAAYMIGITWMWTMVIVLGVLLITLLTRILINFRSSGPAAVCNGEERRDDAFARNIEVYNNIDQEYWGASRSLARGTLVRRVVIIAVILALVFAAEYWGYLGDAVLLPIFIKAGRDLLSLDKSVDKFAKPWFHTKRIMGWLVPSQTQDSWWWKMISWGGKCIDWVLSTSADESQTSSQQDGYQKNPSGSQESGADEPELRPLLSDAPEPTRAGRDMGRVATQGRLL